MANKTISTLPLATDLVLADIPIEQSSVTKHATIALFDARYSATTDPELLAIAGLTSAADTLPYFTGSGTAALASLTTAGRAIIDDASASAQRTTLGLGTLSTQSGTFSGTSSGTNTGDQTITLTGDLTGAGTGSFATSLASSINLTGKTLSNGTITGATVTGLPAPSAASDATTKSYVDGAVTGILAKAAAACSTTANITLSGEQTLDGILTSASRVLVKSQTAPAENGIYVSGAGAWTRSTDMDAWAEVPNAYVFVSAGTTLANTSWLCTNVAGGTIGVTAITWVQYGASSSYSAGTGLGLSGSTFSINDAELLAVAGLTSAANKGITFTGSGSAATYDLSAFALTLLDDAAASNARTTLGLGAVASSSSAADLSAGTLPAARMPALTGDITTSVGATATTLATVNANVGSFGSTTQSAVIAVNAKGLITSASNAAITASAMAYSGLTAIPASIDALDSLTPAVDRLPYFDSASTAALATFTSFGRSLVDDADATAARTTLGLGSMATQLAASVAITGGTINGLSSPTAVSGAATKGYVDGLIGSAVASVAALRLLTTTTHPASFITTASYIAGKRRGGGLYAYVSSDTTTVDNDSTVLVDASSRRWYLCHGGILYTSQCGLVDDGATSDTAVINRAIARLNDGSVNTVVHDGLNTFVDAAFTAIKASDVTFMGAGGLESKIKMSSGVVEGNFFYLGDSTGTSTYARITIKNLTLQIQNLTTASGYAFIANKANDCWITDIRCVTIAGLVNVGPSDTCSRITLKNISGSGTPTLNHIVGLFNRYTGLKIDNVYITGSGASTESGFKFASLDTTVSGCDTLYFMSSSVFYSGGVKHVVEFDATGGSIVNCFLTNCAFDKANTACVKIGMASAGGTSSIFRIRNVIFTACRADTTTCIGLDINQASTDVSAGQPARIENVQWNGGFMLANTTAAVRVQESYTSSVDGISINGVQFQDTTTGAGEAITSLITMGVSDFTVKGCNVMIAQSDAGWPGTSRISYFIETTADVSRFLVEGNRASLLTVGFMKDYAYSDIYDSTRLVVNNLGPNADPVNVL